MKNLIFMSLFCFTILSCNNIQVVELNNQNKIEFGSKKSIEFYAWKNNMPMVIMNQNIRQDNLFVKITLTNITFSDVLVSSKNFENDNEKANIQISKLNDSISEINFSRIYYSDSLDVMLTIKDGKKSIHYIKKDLPIDKVY